MPLMTINFGGWVNQCGGVSYLTSFLVYLKSMCVLVTGAAGFIGSHLSIRLLERGIPVVGLDNINPYYDPSLKLARIARLRSKAEQASTSFKLIEANSEDRPAVEKVFENNKPQKVVNLAAQAGVRYSIENPASYIQSNLVGFSHVLEGCRHHNIKHLIYASSSSVYGGNTNLPFSEHQGVDHPVSLYAASKKANELMAHSYSHLYGLPATGLRFFTVYGPWGRPDMALFLFTKAILAESRSKYSITARWYVTSRTSTISSRAWFACLINRLHPILISIAEDPIRLLVGHHIGCSTLVIQTLRP